MQSSDLLAYQKGNLVRYEQEVYEVIEQRGMELYCCTVFGEMKYDTIPYSKVFSIAITDDNLLWLGINLKNVTDNIYQWRKDDFVISQEHGEDFSVYLDGFQRMYALHEVQNAYEYVTGDKLEMVSSINNTTNWFKQAVPNPTLKNAHRQYDCIKEEFNELEIAVSNDDNVEIADALADIIVTCVGYGYMRGIDVKRCLNEVNRSNFSKFVDGYPIFDESGKIVKGDDYSKPSLEIFIKDK